MNPGRFYMPQYMGMGSNIISNGMRTVNPMIRMANSIPRGIGLFSRITNGIRSVNWGGLLNNANKTLNVVNQAIPLVRQAGPMVNNMRSMLRIAKAFGSETTSQRRNNNVNRQIINNVKSDNNNNNDSNNLNNNSSESVQNLTQKKEEQNVNIPNFFI